jgi:hypothetical protein
VFLGAFLGISAIMNLTVQFNDLTFDFGWSKLLSHLSWNYDKIPSTGQEL